MGIKDDHVSLRTRDEWRVSIKRAGLHILSDGTTLFSGFSLMRLPPLSILQGIVLMCAGKLPWKYGESYVAIIKK